MKLISRKISPICGLLHDSHHNTLQYADTNNLEHSGASLKLELSYLNSIFSLPFCLFKNLTILNKLKKMGKIDAGIIVDFAIYK